MNARTAVARRIVAGRVNEDWTPISLVPEEDDFVLLPLAPQRERFHEEAARYSRWAPDLARVMPFVGLIGGTK